MQLRSGIYENKCHIMKKQTNEQKTKESKHNLLRIPNNGSLIDRKHQVSLLVP